MRTLEMEQERVSACRLFARFVFGLRAWLGAKPRGLITSSLRAPVGQARVEICRGWAQRPANFFSKSVNLIMDNKKFEIPTWAAAKRFSKMKRVRFHLRTPGEGVTVLAVYVRWRLRRGLPQGGT
jgi:hypothetical protein